MVTTTVSMADGIKDPKTGRCTGISTALQLKAVAFGFYVLSGTPTSEASFYLDNAIFIAALLAAFSILFGTREVVSSENHHGMVLAIAFESVVKLVAFLAVGAYVRGEGAGLAFRDWPLMGGRVVPRRVPHRGGGRLGAWTTPST